MIKGVVEICHQAFMGVVTLFSYSVLFIENVFLGKQSTRATSYFRSLKLMAGESFFQKLHVLFKSLYRGSETLDISVTYNSLCNCVRLQKISKNQNQSRILANEKTTVSYLYKYDSFISFQSDTLQCFYLFINHNHKNYQESYHLLRHVKDLLWVFCLRLWTLYKVQWTISYPFQEHE